MSLQISLVFVLMSQLFVLLILCIGFFFGLNLIDLGPDLCYFFPPAGFGFGLFLFPRSLKCASLGGLFEKSLFFTVDSNSYKLSP
jgi:hypothetical protein